MVGIILASHGGFAEGIHQSAEMIFGPQDEFESCILNPDEGPDDIKRKLNEAVASFDDQTEILAFATALFLKRKKFCPPRSAAGTACTARAVACKQF